MFVKAQRVKILSSLIHKKNFEDYQATLDLDSVAKETEGYMSHDLNLLLERAIHAYTVRSRTNGDCKGELLSCIIVVIPSHFLLL